MTAAPTRAPTYLQPRLKAVATSNISSQSAGATNPNASRPATPQSRLSSTRPQTLDPVGQKATSSLIRRTLCPQSADKASSISDLLPPLTSSNDVDVELYALIAIIIKEFVNTWYTKITPDQVFVEEVTRIIAHCTRALEQRLRKVDLEAVIFDELPELLNAHVTAYRTAYYPNQPLPFDTDPRAIYHSLWQSPALEPVPNDREPSAGLIQKENESAYRQLLVQSVLAVLLPIEDLENGCLTALVGQIFSEMIIGNGLGGKACEPWLLWEAITKVAELIKTHSSQSKAQEGVDGSSGSSAPGFNDRTGTKTKSGSRARSWLPTAAFWLLLQYTVLAFTSLRFMIITLSSSSSLPSRSSGNAKMSQHSPLKAPREPPASGVAGVSSPSTGRDLTHNPVKRPILTMSLWSCASNLLDLDIRMPWLCASLSMLQWFSLSGPGQVGRTDGIVDKLLSNAITHHILDASLIPLVLRSTRAALFPGNAPAPPRVIPDAEEQLRIRTRCAEGILGLVPVQAQNVYFGAGVQKRTLEVEETLNVFSDPYANKHFVYGLVELIIVRLMPELAEKGLAELLAERLN